ncbi:hypothetical protein SAMN03159473_01853 [Pseudomonas sp. NFACC52]|nr:hypothetical protein SAMN03159481_02452 [Pseudomonas sp. NFACC56-3]SFK39874.1 hypothetical protein SAMN03159473_01853 [Pseudomonas sp. NFACC52]
MIGLLWRGSLLPLGCEAALLRSLRDRAGASSLATGKRLYNRQARLPFKQGVTERFSA